MKTYSAVELAEIIEKHHAWLSDEDGGVNANLSNADLSYADLSNANLRYANLSNADLSNADLSYADLSYADLSNANLSNADLRYANLRYADLSNADLSYADLRSADLRNADLSNADLILCGAVGNMKNIKSIQCDYWPVTYTVDRMQVGCQNHLIEEWKGFSDSEIEQMDSHALIWWRIWKPILMSIIKASPAEATGFVHGEDK